MPSNTFGGNLYGPLTVTMPDGTVSVVFNGIDDSTRFYTAAVFAVGIQTALNYGSSFDGGGITTDGLGNLTAGSLTVGALTASGNIVQGAGHTVALCNGAFYSDAAGNLGTTSLTSITGHITMNASGATIVVRGGSNNSKIGTFVMNGATNVVVAATSVTANSRILFGMLTPGGTPDGRVQMVSVTAGTGFTVKGIALDTSTYSYWIVEQQ